MYEIKSADLVIPFFVVSLSGHPYHLTDLHISLLCNRAKAMSDDNGQQRQQALTS
jgi:hypothetical protein